MTVDLNNLTIQNGYNDSIEIERVTQDQLSAAGGLICAQTSTQSGYTYVNIDSVSFIANEGAAGGGVTVGDGCRDIIENSTLKGIKPNMVGGYFYPMNH